MIIILLFGSTVGSDYGNQGTSLPFESRVTIPTGSTATQFTVNIIDDNILEQMETFRLSIINVLSGGFCGITTGRTSTTVNIADNDG